ncbi:MAG: helix-turn-helix domain-containing protein, partial [Ruminococcaceae bacterium]|nr:helix-turn-helix domain-containing protein [Oscillospiraceae bacterium]
MDNTNHTTEHRKGQHLCSEERHEIEVRRKDGWSIYKIAQHLGRPYNTIKNEIMRGSTQPKNGGRGVYHADRGEKVYRENRQNSCRRYRCLATIE